MVTEYRYIRVEPEENARCVMFRQQRMTEQEVLELGDEVLRMVDAEDCPRVVLDFASTTPECLYSVFLAKLVSLQRALEAKGGGLRLCSCNPQVVGVFRACCLDRIFTIAPDRAAALDGWSG